MGTLSSMLGGGNGAVRSVQRGSISTAALGNINAQSTGTITATLATAIVNPNKCQIIILNGSMLNGGTIYSNGYVSTVLPSVSGTTLTFSLYNAAFVQAHPSIILGTYDPGTGSISSLWTFSYQVTEFY